MRVAVTGATGFVGAALINQLLERDWAIAALARTPSKLHRANDVRTVVGDLEDDAALADLATSAGVFIHLAGVTHAHARADYFRVNVAGAERAAHAARKAGAKFIHISSISAQQPEVSPYAESKFNSEQAVAAASGENPWLALRLPAIYGPGDRATLPYFKLIKAGLALEPATKTPACASILYVEDAAEAIIAAISAEAGVVYEVGDERPDGREWGEIGRILGEVLNKRPRRIRTPRPVVFAFHGISRAFERLSGQPPSVREGQINEFFHPQWVARDNLLISACDWRPATPLKEGFAKTVRWYQENGYL